MPADALDYITIKGFKSLKSVDKLPLSRANLVIGANGSGKSPYWRFSFLHAIRAGRLEQ
jgi:predicted ATPase